MALPAEHMVDYHVLDKEGVHYEHGSLQVDTSGFRKVNVPYRPNELMAEDWSSVFIHGIDIVAHAIDHSQSVHGVSEEYLERDILAVQKARGGHNAPTNSAAAQTKDNSASRNRQAKGQR